ncbi:hypothetical protein MMC30_008363 [Trapelia coarctata]|nr:hypothetical protein [Trapelia coarctata]
MTKGRPNRGKKQDADNAIAAENLTSLVKAGGGEKRNEVKPTPKPPAPQVSQPKRQARGRPKSTGKAANRGQVHPSRPAAAVRELTSNRDSRAAKPPKSKKGKQLHDRTEVGTVRQPPRLTESAPVAKPRDSRGRFIKKSAVAKEQPELDQQPQVTADEEPRQRSESARPQASALDDWFRQIEAASPDRAQQTHSLYPSGAVQEPDDSMDSSSAEKQTDEAESTAKQTAPRNATTLETKLRLRRVQREPTPDETMEHLRQILQAELPEMRLKDTHALQAAVQDFLDQIAAFPDESCYSYIDDFFFNIDRCKSTLGFPVVNHKYFQADLKRCLARNEAVLQRTIMIHIVNQYWLADIFDWNTEGLWSLPKDNRLPSRKDDEIALPKPDLAISFTLKSFTGAEDDSDPIPTDLERCISPDGGSRCFPFLFMEVKKAAADLQDAEMANLHSASQALFNMYTWLVRAGHQQAFFDGVRVFSLVFNAQDLSVRVHRAVLQADGELSFRFDELSPLARYSKDSACLLIRTILTDYAAAELHPALQKAFVEIIKQEDLRIFTKRKANAARGAVAKRGRKSGDSGSGLRTGQSFGMAGLSTGDTS